MKNPVLVEESIDMYVYKFLRAFRRSVISQRYIAKTTNVGRTQSAALSGHHLRSRCRPLETFLEFVPSPISQNPVLLRRTLRGNATTIDRYITYTLHTHYIRCSTVAGSMRHYFVVGRFRRISLPACSHDTWSLPDSVWIVGVETQNQLCTLCASVYSHEIFLCLTATYVRRLWAGWLGVSFYIRSKMVSECWAKTDMT